MKAIFNEEAAKDVISNLHRTIDSLNDLKQSLDEYISFDYSYDSTKEDAIIHAQYNFGIAELDRAIEQLEDYKDDFIIE